MANAPALVVKVGDTAPAWLITLSDINGPIPLAGNVASVKIAGKGQNTSTLLGPDITTVTTENTFTATTNSSAQLTSVSSFTGIAINSTLVGAGIPSNAVVGSFNSGAGTINMVVAGSITLTTPAGTPISATSSASGVSIIANRGMLSYSPTVTDTGTADIYGVEFAIHWTAGSTLQHVPNSAAANPSIEVDAVLTTPE